MVPSAKMRSARTSWSAASTWRVAAKSRATASSATASALRPGVFSTGIPAAVAAGIGHEPTYFRTMSPVSGSDVTIGIDIGTTSVKAVAADGDGNVVARARVPHRLVISSPDRMEHDAGQAWRRGPRRALAALGDVGARAVCVASMIPAVWAVNRRGGPILPGLLDRH